MNTFGLNPGQQQQQREISLSDTTEVVCEKCGGNTFAPTVLLRKLSPILTGKSKPSYVNISTYMCESCKHVNEEFLPSELG